MPSTKLLTIPRTEVTPDHIMQIGMGFWASKVLMSAVELGVFTYLADTSKTGREIESALGLHPRGTYDLLDTLVALGLLARDGNGSAGRYSNTAETAAFLDRESSQYIGGVLEMANARLYRFWADLTPALKTGQPQNEIKHSGRPVFDELYADPKRLEQFIDAMSGISAANFAVLGEMFDFSAYSTLADIGGASGQLSCLVASRHPHLSCRSCDLPAVKPIAERNIQKHGLSERVQAHVVDFLHDEFPKADIITMGMILHDWNLDRKKMLIAKAYRALPKGGVLIAIENIIDNERRKNVFGLLMSLNMLIEFGDAFDYSGADFRKWCGEVGFKHFEVIHLAGPSSAAVAYK